MQLLVKLNLSYSEITELPETIRDLKELRLIIIFTSMIKKLLTSIGMLKRLEQLHVNCCWFLTEIPSSIGGCTGLRVLNLSFCQNTEQLPKSATDLRSLEELDLILSNR